MPSSTCTNVKKRHYCLRMWFEFCWGQLAAYNRTLEKQYGGREEKGH